MAEHQITLIVSASHLNVGYWTDIDSLYVTYHFFHQLLSSFLSQTRSLHLVYCHFEFENSKLFHAAAECAMRARSKMTCDVTSLQNCTAHALSACCTHCGMT